MKKLDTSDGTKKTSKTKTVPAVELELGNVASKVSKQWTANKWLELKWTTEEEFGTQTTAYTTTLGAKNELQHTRPQITQALKTLDKQIDSNLSYVKGYITEKHKKEAAKSYYPSFGIRQMGSSTRLPVDQNSRSEAMGEMLKAITKNGFGAKEFGTAYWTGIKTQYDLLLNTASANDSQVSVKIADKNQLKKNVKKTLNAIVHMIKANYPDSYKEELRNWGFQKEKY